MTTIEQADKSLLKSAVTRELDSDNLPPIRATTTKTTTTASNEESSVEVCQFLEMNLSSYKQHQEKHLDREQKSDTIF